MSPADLRCALTVALDLDKVPSDTELLDELAAALDPVQILATAIELVAAATEEGDTHV